MNLFNPHLLVRIGKYTFEKGIQVMCVSSSESSFDWVKVKFTGVFTSEITINDLEKSEVYIGYEGQYHCIFKGYVTQNFKLSSSMNELILQDISYLLSKTQIHHVFINAQPMEIVKYCCDTANIKTEISPENFAYSTYPCSNTNALVAIKGINNHWGIKPQTFARDNIFYWGIAPKQEKVFFFKYKENLTSLTKENGFWVINTVAMPFIYHTDKIYIEHPLLTGEYIVHKHTIYTDNAGFAKSEIYIKGAS